ncbi:tetratricopeptide repeat protein [Poritiphilus flavus]|uniref:Tetratricopeptide repeat protein n=1 Tax=Poritiphilus flavus TaxID=2697053 RepID=A0A6L9EFJ0_9FLAO|nr:transcriptional regulator [Poritiphilus flavus]NAS13507.1 tetratricopeptide repeat protein [Poritiphilus flavus]
MRVLLCLILFNCSFLMPGLAQRTEQIIDSLENELSLSKTEDEQRIDILNELGYRYWIVNSGTSVDFGNKALELSEKLQYKPGMAKAKRVLGVAYWTQGKAKLALENLYSSQEIYTQIGDQEGYANALMNTGMVYADISDYEKSLSIYDQSIQKFTELGLKARIATTFTKIGDVLLMQGSYDEAKDYLTNALNMHSDNNYVYGMGEAHNKLAIVLLERGELEQADYHLKKAVEYGSKVNDEDGYIGNLIQFGKLQRLRRNHPDSEEHLLEALELAQKKGLRKYMLAAYKELKLLKKELGLFQESLHYYDAYLTLKDSIFNADKSKQIAALEFGQELEDQQKEIALLQQKEKTSSIINWSLGLGLLGLGIIGFLIFYNQRQKTQKERELVNRKQELMASREELAKTALENANLKQKELQQQLAFKNKELTSYTLNFVQKNELMHQLQEKIKEVKSAPVANQARLLADLERTIRQHVTIDRDWEDFKRSFEEVHTDFYLRLKEKHPDLSANDLKICALTRLNLSIKESSSILGISPESAKTARYRLRKKLGLEPEQEILDYFLELEQSARK